MSSMLDIFSEELSGQQMPEPDVEKKEITFSNKSESYCICFIDVIGSTHITSSLQSSNKLKSFYAVFINEIAAIIKNYGGKILKTVGDGIIFFFPETRNVANKEAFRDAVECLLNLISSRDEINDKLQRAILITISYRISADYGKLEEAQSGDLNSSYDLFGPTLNFCNKINKKAPPNGIAIGADLWRIVNSFPTIPKRYHFEEVKELAWKENRYSYPVYLLRTDKSILIEKFQQAVVPQSPRENDYFEQKHLNIMLIDDDPDISLTFSENLKASGIAVDSFTNSEDALRHFIKSPYCHYDLIVTDIRMPGLNGFELYHQLKSYEPNIKFLFITALNISQEIVSLLPELRITQFISKPVDPITLVSSVKQHARATPKV
jgi:CheY-like chemotaxis protein/class 3 adenylate cyclase